MKLRLEVGRGQRKPFAWFLRSARRHPSFRYERVEGSGQEVVVLEFDEWREMEPYFLEARNRSFVNVYRDGALVDFFTAQEAIWKAKGLTRFGTPPMPKDPNMLTPQTSLMMSEALSVGRRLDPTVCPRCGQPWPQDGP